MKVLAGIHNVDLRVRPDPGALVISGAQNHDVSKDLAVGAFKQIKDENCFSATCLSVDCRMGVLGQKISILLRRTCHFQCSAVHPRLHIGRCSKRLLPRPVL